jgi:DNA-binding transcriptional ArsR family regulator
MERARAPIDRNDWERIIFRLPKSLLPPGVKHCAHALARFGNPDGTRIFPGVVKMALVMGVTERTVIRSLKTLRELGLITRVRRGNTKDESDTYRLTVPANILELLDHPEALTPELEPREPDLYVTPESLSGPVDNSPLSDSDVT